MNLTIQRHQNGKAFTETFDIASLRVTTLLGAFYEIKAKLDPTLTFDAGCRSGVCGRCAVRVNGRETLACGHTLQGGEQIEPLQYHPIQRDLKVDKSKAHAQIVSTDCQSKGTSAHHAPTPEAEQRYRLQTDCILCNSCYSACPVLAVTPDFLGPFALTRAWRYTADTRCATNESPSDPNQNASLLTSHSSLLDTVQTNGIWDCTLCGECTAVCPQGIDPKGDILQLRTASIQAGYSDPTFAQPSFGVPDFGGGFDPNGGFT